MRVIADSHAVIWFGLGSPRLSTSAHDALAGAEADGGIVVSTATLIDLWYVTQTTEAVGRDELATVRRTLLDSPAVELYPIGIDVADSYVNIDRKLLPDPWDRLILATAITLGLPLVTKDTDIQRSRLVPTIW